MKKTLGTMAAAVMVVLLTASFSFAEYTLGGVGNFPYFQLGCLIVGGLIIISLKHKYEKMYTGEVVGAFALYTVLGKYAAPRFSPWTLLTYGLGFAAVFWLLWLGGPGPILTVLSDPVRVARRRWPRGS